MMVGLQVVVSESGYVQFGFWLGLMVARFLWGGCWI